MLKKYLFYHFRWQLSTPLLCIVIVLLDQYLDKLTMTIIANFIGAFIFFWVDRWIFRVYYRHPLWEICEDVHCADCGATSVGYRLVKTDNYDKLEDKEPEFRCSACSKKKLEQLRERGIKTS